MNLGKKVVKDSATIKIDKLREFAMIEWNPLIRFKDSSPRIKEESHSLTFSLRDISILFPKLFN
jgi:hypothetical protein